MAIRSMVPAAAPVLVLGLVLGACGDDDTVSSNTTEAPADNAALCDLAQEMFEQESFPTAAQLEKYTDLAPDELEDAIETAAPPLIAADGDPAKFFIAVADDDVEDAVFEIDEWELDNCGIEHEPPYPDSATEIDPDATRVDVTASEYTFAFDTAVPAGPVSFVMKNTGDEAHFLALSRIADGHTIEEALAFEGDPEEAGIVTNAEFESGMAAPGGNDEEVVTNDLEAGSWVMLCFVAGPDGTPHAFSGMAVPFTVS